MEIVTGSTGEVHVTPIDDAVRNGNIGYLADKIVFTYLDNLSARAITNNEVRVYSGYGMTQGRIFKIDAGEFDSVTIVNGSSGYKRADLIVARYHMNTQTGFESITLHAIEGQPGNSYVDPTYSSGDINSGEDDDFPLYRVRINGLNIEGIDRLFTLVPDGGRLGQLEAKVQSHINTFNALNIRTNLASESTAYPKNGANCRPGIEGVLGSSHGGTGQSTLKGAASSLLTSLDSNATAPTNDLYYIGTSPSSGNTYHKKPISSLWNYLLPKIKSTLGMGTGSTVPVVNGGTGKSSITSGKVLVGNGTNAPSERGIDTNPTANSSNLITSGAVASALASKGYGDMLRATYDPNQDGIIGPENGGTGQNTLAKARNAMGLGNTTGALPVANGGTGQTTAAAARNALGLGNTTGALPIANGGTGATSRLSAAKNLTNEDVGTSATHFVTLTHSWGKFGYSSAANARSAMGLGNTTGALPVANGGTGTTDGTLNGVKLAKSGSKYGYMDGSTFKSFRQPTGNAAVGEVLSGKTFANANSDALTGTMPNRGAWTGTGTPTANGSVRVTIPAGYHNGSGYVTADGSASYAAGQENARSSTWKETLYATSFGENAQKYVANMGLPYRNVVKIKNVSGHPITIEYKNSARYNTGTLQNNTEMVPPNDAVWDSAINGFWAASYTPTSNVYSSSITLEVTFQTKVLRGY